MKLVCKKKIKMATQYNTFENIKALNWRVYYVDSDQFTFDEICCSVITECFEADIIKIERKNRLILIHFPIIYSYPDVLRKLEKYRYQILVDIDCEGEISDIKSKLCSFT